MTSQCSDVAIESVVIMKNDLPNPIGNEGKVLAVQDGAPAWVIAAGLSQPQSALSLRIDPISGTDTPSEDRPAKLFGGDYLAFPFATLQAAVNALPNPWNADCSIQLAAGSHPSGNLIVKGLLGSGEVFVYSDMVDLDTGNATGGSSKTLIDTTKSWTVDQWAGKFLLCPSISGEPLPIASNTSDTLRLGVRQEGGDIIAGFGYSIQEPEATLTGEIQIQESLGRTSGFNFQMVGFAAGSIFNCSDCALQLGKISLAGSIDLLKMISFVADRVAVLGGHVAVSDSSYLALGFVFVGGSPDYGVYLERIHSLAYFGVNAEDSTLDGIYLSDTHFLDPPWPHWVWASDNGGNGLRLSKNTQFNISFAIQEMTGSGNAGFGVEVNSFCELIFAGASVFPTLTGSLGDLTLDRGATSLSWATAFASDGDRVIDSQFFCRVERKD